MEDNAKLIGWLRDEANASLVEGSLCTFQPSTIHQIADAFERCQASLATCEARREALEAENTFLREEISAAAQRQKALAPRENEAGEGL